MSYLPVLLVGGGILALLAFSKGASAQPRVPGPAPTPPPGGGGGGGGGVAPGGGGGTPYPSGLAPGEPSPTTPGAYIDPNTGLGVFPGQPGEGEGGAGLPQSWGGSQSGMPTATGTGVDASSSLWDSLTSAISGSALVGAVHEHLVPAIVHGHRCWVPHYDGYEHGLPPPAGLPVY